MVFPVQQSGMADMASLAKVQVLLNQGELNTR